MLYVGLRGVTPLPFPPNQAPNSMMGETMKGLQKTQPYAYATPRIMLIDEDEIFGNKLLAAARRMNVPVEYKTNVAGIYKDPPHEPEIIILGYDLGRVNGVQLSEFLQNHAKADMIIVVVHGDLSKLQKRLPSAVRAIISKDAGAEHILGMARLLFRCLKPAL